MTNALQDWSQAITGKSIPIFKASVKAISQLTDRRDASTSELAAVILRDPALTAKVLKFANSSFYRSTSQSAVNTVSRAIALMGFETIKDLCLSLALIDSLLVKGNRGRLAKLLANAFHSAVQAREFAARLGHRNLEEIFIATLLFELGEMTFWALADDPEVDLMLEALKKPGMSSEKAQQSVLGFSFRDLTYHLVEVWNLAPLGSILRAAEDPSRKEGKIIGLARELAQLVPGERESDKASVLTSRVASLLNLTTSHARQLIEDNLQISVDMASGYAPTVIRHIRGGGPETDALPGEEVMVDLPPLYPEPDPLLQLKILREVSAMLQGPPDLNLLLETLLEGIYRGAGLDRTLFAIYDPLKTQLRAKFVLGAHVEFLLQNFVFPLKNNPGHPFHDCLFGRRQSIWVKNIAISEYNAVSMHEIKNLLDVKAFFVAPILAREKPVGLFYADRQPSKRPLDDDSFESFRHLAQQASLAIEYLGGREKAGSG